MGNYKTLFFSSVHLHFKSQRFFICFSLLFIVSILSALILINDVVTRQISFENKKAILSSYSENISSLAVSQFYSIEVAPARSEMFLRLDNSDYIHDFEGNSLMLLNKPLGLEFILGVVISLISIVLTYDSVSGKKESGLLKLIHSGSVPRWQLVLAEFSSSLLVVATSLVFVLLVHTLLAAILSETALDLELVLLLITCLLAGVLYAGVFSALGVAVSATSRKSSTSIIKLLTLFTLAVFLIPNLAPLIGSWISPVPQEMAEEGKVNQQLEPVYQSQRQEAAKRIEQEFGLKPGFLNNLNNRNFTADEIKEEDLRIRLNEKILTVLKKIIKEHNEKREYEFGKIEREIERKTRFQQQTRDGIAQVSPYTFLVFILAEVGGQNRTAADYLKDQTNKYQKEVFRPLSSKNTEGLSEIEGYMNMKDLSALPAFSYIPEPFENRFSRSIGHFATLCIFLLIFLILAVVAYNRYDIR